MERICATTPFLLVIVGLPPDLSILTALATALTIHDVSRAEIMILRVGMIRFLTRTLRTTKYAKQPIGFRDHWGMFY